MAGFPYVKEPLRDGFVFRPKIPAVFSNQGKAITLVGTLDSGSDTTLIPIDHAEFLELDLGGKKYPVGGIGGGTLECVETFVTIKLGEYLFPKKLVMVPLSGELPDVIFGRIPFFEEFDVTFRENAKRIELIKIRH